MLCVVCYVFIIVVGDCMVCLVYGGGVCYGRCLLCCVYCGDVLCYCACVWYYMLVLVFVFIILCVYCVSWCYDGGCLL